MKGPKFVSAFAWGTVAAVGMAIGTAAPAMAGDYTLTLDDSPISGSLEPTDDYLTEDNSYIDTYTFTGRAGQRVTITMSSREVDSYLILLDPSGNSLAQNDDSGSSLDAQIEVVLPVDGVYTVYANTYQGGAFGRYTLQATAAGGSSLPPSTGAINPLPPDPLSGGGTSSNTASRFFCDSSGTVPLTMARSRRTGDVLPIIQWTSNWASYTPNERCNIVSSRLVEIDGQFDRLIITAGTWNNQPVVCAAENRDDARQGICASNGLILTAPNRQEAANLIRGLQQSFQQIATGNLPDGILPASSGDGETPLYVDLTNF